MNLHHCLQAKSGGDGHLLPAAGRKPAPSRESGGLGWAEMLDILKAFT